MPYIIPRATWEFLKAAADAHGGVGQGCFYRAMPKADPKDVEEPLEFAACCIHGLIQPQDDVSPTERRFALRHDEWSWDKAAGLVRSTDPHVSALMAVGLYPQVCDTAFTREERGREAEAPNGRKGRGWVRIPFEEWAKRLEVTPDA